MPETHAMLSASGAHRWLVCTKAPELEAKFPNESSVYAEEGTFAHALAELTARYFTGAIAEPDFEKSKEKLVSTEDGKRFYNEELNEHVVSYADHVWKTFEWYRNECMDGFAEFEVKVDFSEWVPAGFGTCDCLIIADEQMEIIDLKYGKGHKVEAENNPQMRLYALGALQKYGMLYDIKTVKTTIFQPRVHPSISSDLITVEDLYKWAENVVKPAAAKAYTFNGEFNPDEEACRFCRARRECKARYDKNLSLFDDRKDPTLITAEEAGQVLVKAKDIKKWLEDLEDLVFKTVYDGTPVEGWKLVEGRSIRKITDTLKAAEALKQAGFEEALLYNRELKSLTSLEKDFGKKAVAEALEGLIVKPQGAPALAPASDKRKEYVKADEIIKAFDE